MTEAANTIARDDDARQAAKQIEKRTRRGVFNAFLESARRKGLNAPALTDGDDRVFSYGELARAAFGLSGPIARASDNHENIGVLLPTGAGALIAVFALQACGRTPAMLNFTAGLANLASACRAAEVTKVITARKFIELGELQPLIDALSEHVEFLYLEDLKEEVALKDKARAFAGPFAPGMFAAQPDPDSAGVILFTSGTEGAPKGVVLSHANILANVEQISAHVEILPTDVFLILCRRSIVMA